MPPLHTHLRPILLILAALALGAGLCALLLPAEQRAVADQLVGFPDSDIASHQARPLVLSLLCFLPAFASAAYVFGSTMDRYLTRQFLSIFGICFLALFMIWLLIDLTEKVSDFRKTQNVLVSLVSFYSVRSPAVCLLLLPYSLLLSLLYCLGKLSTNREIISMIQSGRSLFRLALPLFITGAFCSALSLGLNFHWAPIAYGLQDDVLADLTGKEAPEATQVLYRNSENRRLWMIGAFPANYQKGAPLLDIEVTTTDENLQILSRLTATQAEWSQNNHQWTFQNPLLSRFSPGKEPTFENPPNPLIIKNWSETPWQLIKPGLRPSQLGIPDLNTWLKANSLHRPFADPSPYLTQWHYRFAQSFTCLVTVLLATPLAIHFSRRGAGGGVFFAVILSAILLLSGNVLLAMGEAGTIRPMIAAWLPNVFFSLLGLYLCHRRITGRPIYHSLLKLFPNS